jgi:cell division protease FtsH
MTVGKSRAKVYVETDTKVTFSRIQNRSAASALALRRGLLLVGPPGTGKTLLSSAVAGEAGVAFLHGS